LHSASHPVYISLQVLSSPTTKDFTNVMLFLYRQFDPVLPKTFKLEEEVGLAPPLRVA
jgi:SMC interacting uncharacterized protein involved in chromosome segregation